MYLELGRCFLTAPEEVGRILAMIHPALRRAPICILFLIGSGCNLVDTFNAESAHGRGAIAFDPYNATRSGAIRLVLQNYQGCATLATGEPIGKGSLSVSDQVYPSACSSFDVFNRFGPQTNIRPMPFQAGTPYFLGQLTLMDQVIAPVGPLPPGLTCCQTKEDAFNWITTQSLFRNLDWANLAVAEDRYENVPSQINGDVYFRKVRFAGANWMQNRNPDCSAADGSCFTVDVVNADNQPVSSPVVYARADFLAENAVTYHTNVSFQVYGVGPPQSPGDEQIHPVSDPLAAPPFYMTNVRIDFGDAINPFKTFTVDKGLAGTDGAIRVVWTAAPNQPFYFPVHFIDPSDVPNTCWSPDGSSRVPCSFGVDPNLRFSPPANGSFYQPGERYTVQVQIRDSLGNLLHAPDALPSRNEEASNQANGLLYEDFADFTFQEGGHFAVLRNAGPIQSMRPLYSKDNAPWVKWEKVESFGAVDTSQPGRADVEEPTEVTYYVPPNAQPGTYVALFKVPRQFMGERISRTRAFFFQVGQSAPTQFPGRVGNCQLCHRSVLSLENLFHGMPVDNVEGCKTCHTQFEGRGSISELLDLVHRIHMTSEKYPLPKRECVACHLTKESAIRPSIEVCNACHPNVHGNQFFAQSYGLSPDPNRFSNCGQACHVLSPPSQHVLPNQ